MENLLLVSDNMDVSKSAAPSNLFPTAQQCVHTPCYCEENVWKLCDHVKSKSITDLKKCYAVFISNKNRQIPIWHQKASRQDDRLVIWDYHVILIYQGGKDNLVYDLDTELPFPCSLHDYISNAIRDDNMLRSDFRRLFRVVAGDVYTDTFASDRSHMLNEDGTWKAEPPPYPCIRTPNNQNNLQDFICMERNVGVGTVLTAPQLLQKFSLPSE